MGHRVMTIAPRYDQYKDAWDTSVLVEVYVFVVLLCSLHLTWSCLMIFIFYKKTEICFASTGKYWWHGRNCSLLPLPQKRSRSCFCRSSYVSWKGLLNLLIHCMLNCLLNNLSTGGDLSMLHLNHILQIWGKTGAKLYGPTTGSDYRDNQLRFCLLCLVSNPITLSKPMHSLS